MDKLLIEQLKLLHKAAVLQLGYICGRMEYLGGHKYQGAYEFLAREDPELGTLFYDAVQKGYQEQKAIDTLGV